MTKPPVVVDEWAVPTTDREEQRFRLVDFGEEFGLEFLDGTWEPVELVCVQSTAADGAAGDMDLVALRAAVFSALCARIAQQATKAQVVQ